MQRHEDLQRYFWQNACPANGSRQARDCGKIIKKLCNYSGITVKNEKAKAKPLGARLLKSF